MEGVAKLGISMKEVTDKLTDDGCAVFAEAFDKLLAAVEKSTKAEIRAAGIASVSAGWSGIIRVGIVGVKDLATTGDRHLQPTRR